MLGVSEDFFTAHIAPELMWIRRGAAKLVSLRELERWLESSTIQREISSAFSDGSPPIRVRIGVHTGDALQEADHFFGKTVHYAARVASHALGGEVPMSNVVHDLVSGPGIDFQESREVELKGLGGLHRLFALDFTQ